jgi:hypothetical protein
MLAAFEVLKFEGWRSFRRSYRRNGGRLPHERSGDDAAKKKNVEKESTHRLTIQQEFGMPASVIEVTGESR